MQNFKQFEISSNPFNVDLLSGLLWELDILGINENDKSLVISVNSESDVDLKQVRDLVNTLVTENLIESFEVSESLLEGKNWNEDWEKKLNIIKVTDRIVIKPSSRNYEARKGEIILIIDPKMSFGTGEHQTTKIVLQLLEKYIYVKDKVLDVGSGTALLGIAASKFGASRVVAVDNDEWCYINGKENAERNNVDNIEIVLGTIDEVVESEFDLILANINRNVLLEIRESLYNKLKHGGKLILSGILDTDLDEIKRQFTSLGLTALKIHQIDEWIGIVLIKV
jgi:ribosomal protein L11 methyltransferase